MRKQLKTVHITPEMRHRSKKPPAFSGQDPARQENLFVIRNEAGLGALRFWLMSRKYNTFIESTDARGNPIMGLLWDYHLGRQPSPKRMERGLVVFWDKKLQKAGAQIILNHIAIENEYGKIWVSQQRDLWKYGRS